VGSNPIEDAALREKVECRESKVEGTILVYSLLSPFNFLAEGAGTVRNLAKRRMRPPKTAVPDLRVLWVRLPPVSFDHVHRANDTSLQDKRVRE
jgi:hypothetical protein